MTVVIVALLILGILQLASFAELCVLAYRMDERKKVAASGTLHFNIDARGADTSPEQVRRAVEAALERFPKA
jgi:hypothetical protein